MPPALQASRRFVLSSLLLCASPRLWAQNTPQRFIYPANEIPNDTRFADLIEILRTALDKTTPEFGPYQLSPAQEPMSKARYMALLEQGREPNIVWSSTSIELEQQFLPLRIPLRRGLLGYRLCLIHQEMQEKLDQALNLAQLKHFSVGQGTNWGDARIYEALGMQVVRAKYGNLFAMLDNRRFDLFPRGVNEIFAEYEQHKAAFPNLRIEKNLVLHYPWPYYFFFAKGDAARRRRIESGLRMMLKDGSFQTIFQKHHATALAQADLGRRRLLRLHNPLLPPQTPLQDASLWHNLR
ncbi:amino acid ABC transporter substrate-binding protein [Massilia sp. W12]|uniref:amino acid ABC transporter substrate-binding protein n=1 Tax=Massilia sp. W12 TaxID=3126507 RepID=UPI0030CDE15B